jgi:hypothetical protein
MLVVCLQSTGICTKLQEDSGRSDKQSGYALVRIWENDKEVFSTIVDFYSKTPDERVHFVSPSLPKGEYTLTVKVTDENSTWTDKKATIHYGSDDFYVTFYDVVEL